MKIYFVSGFLGSGKTTSIINAGRLLMAEGKKIGVVTNDQGKYLVDSHFVSAFGIPSVEVSNGCFCCNYDDFDSHILDLAETEKPDIIFAESVGSCADILATVMKPLSDFRNNYDFSSVLSAFTDARLLRARLSGGKLPFSDDVIYIFDKQIEESEVLVINKIDLLSPDETSALKLLAETRYPDKKILLQSAFDDSMLIHWTELMGNLSSSQKDQISMSMDYSKYAEGELKMAWNDKMFNFNSGEDLSEPVEKLFQWLSEKLISGNLPAGHLKLFIEPDIGPAFKLSLTGMDKNPQINIPGRIGNEARIILNARVETEPHILENIINEVFSRIERTYSLNITVIDENSFRPGIPQPVHRYG